MGIRKDRNCRNPGYEQTDDHPPVCLNGSDVATYMFWLSETVEGDWYFHNPPQRGEVVQWRFWQFTQRCFIDDRADVGN